MLQIRTRKITMGRIRALGFGTGCPYEARWKGWPLAVAMPNWGGGARDHPRVQEQERVYRCIGTNRLGAGGHLRRRLLVGLGLDSESRARGRWVTEIDYDIENDLG